MEDEQIGELLTISVITADLQVFVCDDVTEPTNPQAHAVRDDLCFLRTSILAAEQSAL